ncbi:major facilitator superfamily domain-containing protein [Chaetomidium leptoderma]|uniref:Major facilitator superfamily domain-containing protein n=1 Tax=Chaetomidium leptoderma TaxID=669021 RepID=A0AAN6VVF2_9PEZI|nr:major facilitator superfamily domain-containing protein [Chaetomidium leptoderma]
MTTNLDSHRHGDHDSSATSPTVAEDTPLLRSESSSVTARDASPTSDRQQPGPAPEQQPLGWKRTTCIVLSMWALIFLQASNMSGISTTQSTIAADLDAYESAMWFTSAYMISMSSVAPLAGRLAMIFSPATMILLASAFFAVGALVTATAPSLAVFISGRVITGIGSGGVMTLCMILVIQLTSKKRRGLWIGLTNAGFTIGVSAGAVVFGALLPVLGWRLLFGAQAPLAALAGLGVSLSIPPFAAQENVKDKTTLQKLAGLDYAGAATLTMTIVLFLYGLSGTIQPLPILLSLVTLAMFLVIESRASDPVIPLDVLKSRGVLLSCLSQLGFMAARWTVLFYAPIFVLAVRGFSPAIAGSVLIPTNAGFGLGGLIVGAFHIRHAGSFWFPALLSLSLFSIALFALGFVSNAAASAGVYVAIVFVNGLSTGAALNYSLAHLLHLSRPDVHFIVTGLLATFRGFAGSFGTAIGGGVFTRTLRDALVEGFRRLDGGEGLGKPREKLITVLIGSPAVVWKEGVLSVAERDVAVLGYERALEVLYKSAAVVCLLMLVMQAGTGWAAPADVKEDDEEFEEAVAAQDRAMEA